MKALCWDEEESWNVCWEIRKHFWFGMVSKMYVVSVRDKKKEKKGKEASSLIKSTSIYIHQAELHQAWAFRGILDSHINIGHHKHRLKHIISTLNASFMKTFILKTVGPKNIYLMCERKKKNRIGQPYFSVFFLLLSFLRSSLRLCADDHSVFSKMKVVLLVIL